MRWKSLLQSDKDMRRMSGIRKRVGESPGTAKVLNPRTVWEILAPLNAVYGAQSVKDKKRRTRTSWTGRGIRMGAEHRQTVIGALREIEDKIIRDRKTRVFQRMKPELGDIWQTTGWKSMAEQERSREEVKAERKESMLKGEHRRGLCEHPDTVAPWDLLEVWT
ncbi:hypothetical protein CPB83DRAFT_837741 [Crepidotus variabilis]|uniref:Uncharacterized protein n=1 Tax=Crepidotus variabilis TaxID=179855 RepID=A0A9P6JMA0_9AGAR|nr:hypothetical protein CPB83DRAFT_837741 [Crepidotus variabilis]